MKKGRRKSHQWKGKFVCVFLCLCVCVCLCVFVSTCGCVFACVLCCVLVCVHVHTCVHACVPVSVVSVGFCMYVYVCNFVYVFVCTQISQWHFSTQFPNFANLPQRNLWYIDIFVNHLQNCAKLWKLCFLSKFSILCSGVYPTCKWTARSRSIFPGWIPYCSIPVVCMCPCGLVCGCARKYVDVSTYPHNH